MFGNFFKRKEEESTRDVVEVTPEMAQQQLVELIRKVLPTNRFVTPEMIVPIIVIVGTLIMSKLDFDKQAVLQTVQDTTGQVSTIYNQWVPVALYILYAVLGGGSLTYASAVTKHKEASKQEAARSISLYSSFLKEQEVSRGLMYKARTLELQNVALDKEIELQKIASGANITLEEPTVQNDIYGDVSPEIK